MEEYAPLIVEMVERALVEIEKHGLVTQTKRGGGKLNPAWSSLRDSLQLLDNIPAIDLDERVERLELEGVIARLEAIALNAKES